MLIESISGNDDRPVKEQGLKKFNVIDLVSIQEYYYPLENEDI
jgi:hypothetical protein